MGTQAPSALLFALLSIAWTASPAASSETGAVNVQMRNVNLRIAPGVVLQIRTLRGRMVPTSHDRPVTLDKRDSFHVELDSAVIAISASSLSRLLNSYVFAYPGASLEEYFGFDKGWKAP